jgi:hypothetical protein
LIAAAESEGKIDVEQATLQFALALFTEGKLEL